MGDNTVTFDTISDIKYLTVPQSNEEIVYFKHKQIHHLIVARLVREVCADILEPYELDTATETNINVAAAYYFIVCMHRCGVSMITNEKTDIKKIALNTAKSRFTNGRAVFNLYSDSNIETVNENIHYTPVQTNVEDFSIIKLLNIIHNRV